MKAEAKALARAEKAKAKPAKVEKVAKVKTVKPKPTSNAPKFASVKERMAWVRS